MRERVRYSMRGTENEEWTEDEKGKLCKTSITRELHVSVIAYYIYVYYIYNRCITHIRNYQDEKNKMMD